MYFYQNPIKQLLLNKKIPQISRSFFKLFIFTETSVRDPKNLSGWHKPLAEFPSSSVRLGPCKTKRDILPISFTWNSKANQFFYGCFNWMIQNLYMGNGCFTKHPFINGCLEFQVILLMAEIPNNHLGWCWNPFWILFSTTVPSTGERRIFCDPSTVSWPEQIIWRIWDFCAMAMILIKCDGFEEIFSSPSPKKHI